jgi:MFS family permease
MAIDKNFAAPVAGSAERTRKNLIFFLVGLSLLSLAGSMLDTTFNNFLNDVHHLDAEKRGVLEFPRELPGFLTVFMIASLVFLSETRIAAAAACATGLGMLGLAWCGSSWSYMLFGLILWSTGQHLIMPVRSSIAMDLSEGAATRGKRLGQVNSYTAAASVVGYGLMWALLAWIGPKYHMVFTVAGVCALLGGGVLFFMRMPNAHLVRPRFVWNWKYWLYYLLAFFFGARKQIFITFGPWVLIKIFHQPAILFAKLMLVNALLAILFQPTLGRAIDRFGERAVLMVDALVTFLVCLGYACAHWIGYADVALMILCACFVLDQLFMGTGMARDIYLSKIAVRKEDVAPTLSMGITINHVVSMSIPALGGVIWMWYGHEYVFFAAAALALVMLFFANMIRVQGANDGRR